MSVTKDSLCNCGTKVDAYKTALKVMNEMVDRDCPAWALQVSLALHQLCLVVASGITLEKPSDESNKTLIKQMAVELATAAMADKEIYEGVAELSSKIATKSLSSMPVDEALDTLLRKLAKGL